MDIDEYLEASGKTAEEFAVNVPISPVSLSRIRRGLQNTTIEVMRAIVAASNGMISAETIIHAYRASSDAPELSAGNVSQNSDHRERQTA